MAYERIKTEHAGAKNGDGAWMKRAEAKQTAKRQRRQEDKDAAGDDQAAADRGDLDEFSARGSEPTLQQLDEEEAAGGFSWKKRDADRRADAGCRRCGAKLTRIALTPLRLAQ